MSIVIVAKRRSVAQLVAGLVQPSAAIIDIIEIVQQRIGDGFQPVAIVI